MIISVKDIENEKCEIEIINKEDDLEVQLNNNLAPIETSKNNARCEPLHIIWRS